MALAKSKMGLPLVVFCLLITGCLCSHSQRHFNKHVALFMFGDSLFDSGNNNYINTTTEYQANYWPYGESYFKYPTGRFSDGRLIPDFVAELATLPLIPAYLDPRNKEFVYGANFASAGAGALVETRAGLVVNLQTQLQYFGVLEKHLRRKLGDSKTKLLISDAVYLFSCGSNDYLFRAVGNTGNESILYPYTHEQYVGMVIGNLTRVFKGIHEKGGRKFGILNVPPLGCWPSVRVGQPGNRCNEELEIIVNLHNVELSEKLQQLENELAGFMYAKHDLWTSITNRIENPSKYGFKVGESACCGSGPLRGINSCGGKKEVKEYELCDNPSDYFFFDSYHPNEVASRQVAELFWNGDSDNNNNNNNNVTSPYDLKALFKG